MAKTILINHSVVDSILTYARIVHPREGILLLRGKEEKNRILLDEVVIPPLAVHGRGFSTFPLHMLPIDFSILGTFHSHPSGALRPSIGDLNHYYSRIMVIAAHPYTSPRDIAAFDRNGNLVTYEIDDSEKPKG